MGSRPSLDAFQNQSQHQCLVPANWHYSAAAKPLKKGSKCSLVGGSLVLQQPAGPVKYDDENKSHDNHGGFPVSNMLCFD